MLLRSIELYRLCYSQYVWYDTVLSVPDYISMHK